MRRAVDSFRGEAPRVTPRALPDNAAVEATNTKLLTGDLVAWRQFAMTVGLANPGIVNTVFLLNDTWLSWTAQVDVARGAVAGDTTYRTYLTSPGFYAEPRFTNYALATTGSAPYPVATRPLGVPAPDTAPSLEVGIDTTPTSFSIDIFDDGTTLATNWTTAVSAGASISQLSPSGYQIDASGSSATMKRNFGIASASVMIFSTDFKFPSGADNLAQLNVAVMHNVDSTNAISVSHQYKNSSPLILGINGAAITQTGFFGFTDDVWYTLTVQLVVNADNTQTVTATLYEGSTQLYVLSTVNLFTLGDYCSMSMSNGLTGSAVQIIYDNISVRATGSTNYTAANTATSYVYTFVDDLSEESAPSPVSSTVLRPSGVSITVTTPVAIPSGVSTDYGITTKRIYRAATGNAGTEFLFVAELPLATASYVDVLTDAQLGEVLPSDLWALPPDDLEGILALPNGVMAGFSKNQLCLSAQNHPHAWPVEYRLNTDTDIVGIGAIDTMVVIGTKSFVYWAVGNDPAAYSMAKSEVPYACVSKTSFAYLEGIGVAFAGTDGLMVSSGIGRIQNITDKVFTRDQWQALDPTSIHAVAHNDIYFMYWEAGSARGCYAIDMKPTGFGVIEMAFHASAAYVDPLTDKMYLVLDEDNEPDDALLPMPAQPPHYIDGRTLYEFEGDPSTLMTYRWRSKLWMLPAPTVFTFAQVRAEDFTNLLLRVYGDGVQVDELVIEGDTEFTLAKSDEYATMFLELLGTSTVRIVQVAEDITELE